MTLKEALVVRHSIDSVDKPPFRSAIEGKKLVSITFNETEAGGSMVQWERFWRDTHTGGILEELFKVYGIEEVVLSTSMARGFEV